MRTVKVRILPPQPIFSFKNSVGGVGCFYSSCRTAVCRRNPCFQSEALVFGQIPHANASKSRSLVSAIQSDCFAISLDVRDFGAQTSPVPISQDCQPKDCGLLSPRDAKVHPRGSRCSLRTNASTLHLCAPRIFGPFGKRRVSRFSQRRSAWRPPFLPVRRYPDKTSIWFPARTGPMEIPSCNGKTSLP